MINSILCLPKSRAVLINSLSMIATLSLGSSPGLAAGDPAAGKRFFALHCGACHATEPGVNKIGPSLAGIVGRKSGSAPGFNYSPALKAANITWDEQTLDKWLQNPMGDVHGSRMVLIVPNAADRQMVVGYLETLK
jgi:cytochrome c